MDEAIKLKTVDIKSLSRNQLEVAYLRLLKVSQMKTQLIEYLEQESKNKKQKGNPS